MAKDKLGEYSAKRKFEATPEPGPVPVEGRRGNGLGERPALQVLHGDEQRPRLGVATGVVDHDDAGMREAAGDARLREEALLEGRVLLRRHRKGEVDELQGERPPQGRVEGFVDHAHHPAADLAADLVAADPRGRGLAGE